MLSERYVVFEVGCLECSIDSQADPEIVAKTDSLDEAITLIREKRWAGDADRFALDLHDGTVIRSDAGD